MFVGIDLAGSEKRKTGFCVLDERLFAETKVVYTDKEILREVERVSPAVVAIDAPLAMPLGKKSLRKKGPPHLRACDREVLKLGIKIFPITLGPMRKLTRRGIRLRRKLEERGFRVIETYPGAAQDILGIPRKQRGIHLLEKGLEEKLRIKLKGKNLSGDELDAVTCAYVAWLFHNGKAMCLGDEREILMVLPQPKLRK